MTQLPLVDRPAGRPSGIWSRLLDADRYVDAAAWRHHLDTRQHVGKCHCGQPLRPGEPYAVGARPAYPTTCIAPAAHEAVAYGPRLPAKRKGAA
jgi:hypothetical protein